MKHVTEQTTIFFLVTPCVGVWIETVQVLHSIDLEMSHPAWVCGLKQSRNGLHTKLVKSVTPCVGVWIETLILITLDQPPIVTPCVGVWIET